MTTLTVSQLNFFVKSLLESDGRLGDLRIAGEISNFTDHYRSGHLYFSLKDEKSTVKAVMFAGAAKRLKFRPSDGMKVIVRGRVSVYEAAGQYQLYAEDMQPDGLGALSLAYEQLKNRLAQEGLFEAARKKNLPAYPGKIGVITSPVGAALQDIREITARRWPLAELVLCPVQVQGESAPRQMISALRELNRRHACEVILLGRGGGSMEDLWAFNDEALARAVAASDIPVVSCVGHETDFTICDFAADLRAPTPSAAAELATPDLQEERRRLSALDALLRGQADLLLNTRREELDVLLSGSLLSRPEALFTPQRETLGRLYGRALSAAARRLDGSREALALLAGKLDALSPLRVLSRGYAVVTNRTGRVIKAADELQQGDEVLLRLSVGQARAKITERGEREEDG